jgi:hypothetical protein
MRNSDPQAFREYQELVGAPNPTDGTFEPLSPLNVASYMIDNGAEFAREMTGIEPAARAANRSGDQFERRVSTLSDPKPEK